MGEASPSVGERPGAAAEPDLRVTVDALLGTDISRRETAINALTRMGADAVPHLISSLRRHASRPQDLPLIVEALTSLGRAVLTSLLGSAEAICGMKTAADRVVLFNILEAIDQIKDKKSAPALAGILARLPAEVLDPACADQLELIRVKLHIMLAELGDASSVPDLLKLLGDGRHRVRDGVVRSCARVADARALVPLVRLYGVEERVSSAGAQEIKQAFRDIVRRHAVPADSPVFAEVADGERATLDRLFPKHPKPANGHPNGNASANGNAPVGGTGAVPKP